MCISTPSFRMEDERTVHPRCRAFSLIQLLVAVVVFAVIASIGLLAVSRYQTAVREQKLRTDVATLNHATRAFLVSGGNFSGVTTIDAALERLKSVALAADREALVGLRGATIDPRIVAIPVPLEEESGTRLRARWDVMTQRFEMDTTGAGVKEFMLDVAAVATAHQRATAVKFSKEDAWIWDYTDRDGSRTQPPAELTVMAPDLQPPVPGAPESAVALKAPAIRVSGGRFPLSEFPLAVRVVSDVGNPVDSVDFYSLDGGSTWFVYREPFKVDPDSRVIAYTATSDPNLFIDSPQIFEDYRTEAVQMEFDLATLKKNFTYAELGRSLMPGSPSPPVQAKPASFKLLNSSSIPLSYQNSEVFEIRYTYDGGDPSSDPDKAKSGDSFMNGFSSQSIPVDLLTFGAGNVLPIQAFGRALNTAVVQDSEVETVVITGDTLPLAPPEIKVNETSGGVSLGFVLEKADVPEGAYIYYSIDGTDPGDDGAGKPSEGQLYTGPFRPEADVQIVARVYAPPEFSNWFVVSKPVQMTLIVPSYDVYIGGDFYLNGTVKSHRNVARLASDGLIDTEFNPGAGTNAGSIVGAVLRQGGNSVVVGGDFQTMRGVVIPAIVRLDETGAIDGTFDAALE